MVFKSQFQDVKPSDEFKESLSLFYWHQLDKHAKRTLFIDYVSGRQWTGAEIKRKAVSIANFLIEEVGLKPRNSCVLFYPNDDRMQILSLGVLFAGGSVCVGYHADPRLEHCHMLNVMQPAVVLCTPALHQEMVELREENKFNYKICIVGEAGNLLGTSRDDIMTFELPDFIHGDSMNDITLDTPDSSCNSSRRSAESSASSSSSSQTLPIVVEPDDPAYVLLTSGSTGHPKPVARSHRNSIHVCHTLTPEVCECLWDLNEDSVLAGHLQLDHGTGTFCTKMTLAKGLKLIIMDGYQLEAMLTAIDRYQISDILLGSALLHNFISSPKSVLDKYNLSSLRNFLSVGSRLPSHSLALKFMADYPAVSIRQTFGLTEVGFTFIVERHRAKEDNETVGLLLPNVQIKLLDLNTGEEITEPNREGELYFAGPTVSPGYLIYDSYKEADRLREQTRKAFLDDGYYRSFDVGSFTPDGRLRMRGRCNDVLCLHDGWKVLPQEIEIVLIEHPAIHEAAVVGIPHPELPSCHAPRAYIILKEAWKDRVTEEEIFQYVAERVSEPKQLVGGVRFMDTLPRARLSKVDRRALLRMDGFN